MKINNNELIILLNKYDAGTSATKLAKEYNYTVTGMTNLLKRNNRFVIPTTERIIKNWAFLHKKDDFFYYWLGWMLSDGNIIERYNKSGFRKGIIIKVAIHKKDTHILEFFRDIIQPHAKINHGRDNTAIISLALPRENYEIIKSYGFVPNKTLKFKMTKNLEAITGDNFLQLLVGLIEGDGSIDIQKLHTKKKSGKIYYYNIPRVRLTNHLNLITWVRDTLTKFGFKKRNIIYHNNCAELSISGKDAASLISSLKSCRIKLLNRKWDIYG